MPNPSYWPLVSALGIALFFAGFRWNAGYQAVTFIGLVVAVVGIFSWALEPAADEPPAVEGAHSH